MAGLKVKCPTCKKEVTWDEAPSRPFCSERCRLIDLGEWASEKYSVTDEHSSPDSMDPNHEEKSGDRDEED